MRISDWRSYVCSSDLLKAGVDQQPDCDPGERRSGQRKRLLDVMDQFGIVDVPAQLTGKWPDQRQFVLEGVLGATLRRSQFEHTDRQKNQTQSAEHSLGGEKSHDQPVAKQPPPRNLGGGVDRKSTRLNS